MTRQLRTVLLTACLAGCGGTTDPSPPAVDALGVGIYAFVAGYDSPTSSIPGTVRLAGTIKFTEVSDSALVGDFTFIQTSTPSDTSRSPSYLNHVGTLEGTWTGSSYSTTFRWLAPLRVEFRRDAYDCSGSMTETSSSGTSVRPLTHCELTR